MLVGAAAVAAAPTANADDPNLQSPVQNPHVKR